ncbi:DNA cytosine methyltransferase [Parendozoicomonas haliclonae]|uniref:Cytosine-specific methyltransferase n=1 Tax=Parendozoicomonas haliclonae TaxID=1960125 RepID=A0A1X7AQ37_9GAMM|nr:DNA (cytosine-5-)-methyltransferase [Parendozoicomonas haliclonae]SMA49516.1 Modification methylase HhaI [Parendozoicomonas haliclonae]
MRAIEMFAGIGGFRLACDELGIETVWANDIEPKASTVYRDRFGKGVHIEGDVSQLIDQIPDHDLLTAGFPCQPFSSAGKKLGIEDVRGTLFEKIVQVIRNKKPKFFVLENVKRLLSMDKGAHFATILDALSELGYLVEWRVLNAVNFGLPQNRERVVIIGHLDHGVKSYLCTAQDIATSLSVRQIGAVANLSRWPKITDHGAKFHNWGLATQGRFHHAKIDSFSDALPAVKLSAILESDPDRSFYFTEDTLERIKTSEKVDRFYNGVEILYNQKGGARMGYSIFGTAGVAPTLTCTTSRHYERYKIGDEFRRLTNVEYARIQGFPEQHCQTASRYDQYPLFGNAVPPQMVKWVIQRTINKQCVDFQAQVVQEELL